MAYLFPLGTYEFETTGDSNDCDPALQSFGCCRSGVSRCLVFLNQGTCPLGGVGKDRQVVRSNQTNELSDVLIVTSAGPSTGSQTGGVHHTKDFRDPEIRLLVASVFEMQNKKTGPWLCGIENVLFYCLHIDRQGLAVCRTYPQLPLRVENKPVLLGGSLFG